MKNMTEMMMAATLAVGTLAAAGCQTTPSVTAPVTQPITVIFKEIKRQWFAWIKE